MATKKPIRNKTGPEPSRVKIDASWEKAVAGALSKPRPEKGWPGAPKSTPSKKKKKPA